MFRKRNLLVAIAAFVIGIGTFAVVWGVPRLLRRSTSIDSQVTAYLLDERGNVNGLLLASGDQLRFSPETGTVVASQIKVGDQVAVNGHVGSQSSYGREVRVEQITANGQTIVEAKSGPPHRHGPDDKRGPRGRDDRAGGPGPREKPQARENVEAQPTAEAPVGSETKPIEQNPVSGTDPNARQTEGAAPAVPPASQPSPEIFKAASTIRTHLVNGRGDVDGLILSSGEQVRFSPRIHPKEKKTAPTTSA